MRNINLEDTIYPKFTTRAFATGIPATLGGTPVLSIYEENNLTQITAGVSITADYDSVTGLNQATIVATSANGYEAGKSYDLVITTGTVGGVSVVGEVVYSFKVRTIVEMFQFYAGADGPGIFIDSGAANTNTVLGTDGTENNPVSTFAAARTLADALGVKVYYLEGNSDITLAATHVDWEFIGLGSISDNIINLGSQDVSRSLFRNLTIEGTQGGTGRITARDCALQDPGAGATTLHIFAERCGFVDEIELDTSNDNVFDSCYSLVAGTAAPSIVATGAAGTVSIRHHSGGVEFKTLSASHNVTWEGIGQVIFNADCNVNANVSVRGIGTITDNTAGMASLTETALVNMTKINTECDTALSDYDGPTNTEMVAAFTELKGATWSAATDTIEHIRNKQTDIEADTNELQTNQGNWLTATGFATEAKQDAQDAIITEARLAELDAANLPADIDNLNLGIIYGAAATGTLSTTQATSDLTGYADDQLIGRVIIWTSGACEGEGTDITDYASASGLLTFTALTTAPGNGDTFKIV